MIHQIAEVLGTDRHWSGTPAYGQVLVKLFRALRDYMEDHPDSRFTDELRELMQSASKRRYRKRGKSPILQNLERIPSEREDYTFEDAHGAALQHEGTRILRRRKKK